MVELLGKNLGSGSCSSLQGLESLSVVFLFSGQGRLACALLCLDQLTATLRYHMSWILYISLMKVSVTQLCLTLWDPMDYIPLDSSVRGLCPWTSPGKNTGVGSLPLSRGSSWPRDQTGSPALQMDPLLSEPPGKPNCSFSLDPLCPFEADFWSKYRVSCWLSIKEIEHNSKSSTYCIKTDIWGKTRSSKSAFNTWEKQVGLSVEPTGIRVHV